jgi:hypothetical protein
LVQWSDDYSDFGDVLERRLRAGLPITTGTVGVTALTIRTNPGHTPYLTGTYANPVVELRFSKDGGFEWSNWKQKPLGANGKFRLNPTWRSLGFFAYPGALFEIRVTDPVPFRISGMVANDGYGNI